MTNFIKATTEDILLIQKLAESSWNAAYKHILSPEQIDFMLGEMYSEKNISGQMQNPDYHYFVVYFDEKPAGFLGFEHHYEEGSTKLHRIYFLPDVHGKGLGKIAVDFVKTKAKESGDKRIILNVNKFNTAKNFYEKLGFQVYDDVVIDVGNGYVMDDFLMEFKF